MMYEVEFWAKQQVWEKHKAELGDGRFDLWMSKSTTEPFFCASFTPSSVPDGPIELSDKVITGTLGWPYDYQISIFQSARP